MSVTKIVGIEQGFSGLLHHCSQERVQFWLERVGVLSYSEIVQYVPAQLPEVVDHLQTLVKLKRAVYIAKENGKALYVSKLNTALLQALTDPSKPGSCSLIIQNYMHTHGPFTIQTLIIPANLWETSILPIRIEQYNPAQLE